MQWPFKQWGADVVIAGHDHHYERLEVDGLPYIINGLGGKSIRSVGTPSGNSQFIYDDNYGAMFATATDEELTLEFHSISSGGTFIDSLTIAAADNPQVPPSVSIDDVPQVNPLEGSQVALTSTVTDPNSQDTFTYLWEVSASNGQVITDGTSDSFTFTPNNNGVYTITLSVTDSQGGVGADVAVMTVDNVAPTAFVLNGGPVNEGRDGFVQFVFQSDPSSADSTAGLLYSYDFDNDGTFEISQNNSSNAIVPASFLSDGPSRLIKMRVEDIDEGFTDYTTLIPIINIAPELLFNPETQAAINNPLSQEITIVDPGEEGDGIDDGAVPNIGWHIQVDFDNDSNIDSDFIQLLEHLN